jgi:hypothetical protein
MRNPVLVIVVKKFDRRKSTIFQQRRHIFIFRKPDVAALDDPFLAKD